MQEKSPLARALDVVRDLRRRCPWDRAQTRETLRPYLVEEVFELDHALSEGKPDAIREEVADLLLHLAWQFVLAEERREFTPEDVAADLEQKMRRRHPQLYDLGPPERWENLKRKERTRGVLDGLPPGLPDILLAYRLQERAATVGFDWPNAAGPLAKVREELGEVERQLTEDAADDPDVHSARAEEIGDLLFAVINLARKVGVQPGLALDRANRKFRDRIAAIERLALERRIDIQSAGLAALDSLWEEVKAHGRSSAETGA